MNNPYNNQTSQNTESPEIYAARLALIGSALSTLGDGLQAIAAGIALQELEKSKQASETPQNPSSELDQTSELEKMQKQIDRLANKIERMERLVR
ncbi:translation initiation factor 2 [Sporosarcina oncorhynchi]|uniref:Translation initiation factor 2 n=1 Tax=Sporosarcina oncorhynchi TaxID=3056444 RepID=A0ABZ0L5V8_9BACL|nr:translation initiation factor 2 [Sporosarcina sp. T2O-4]WOV87870.1 translation initiation factor 2 [Sporosarcina sp. T2O-4]